VAGTAAFSTHRSQHHCAPGDFVVVNNSFVHRDQVKTKKSPLMLAVKLKGDGTAGVQPYVIETSVGQNADFRKLGATNAAKAVPLGAVLDDQLDALGELLFTLIGQTRDDVVLEEPVNNGVIKTLRLNPGLPVVARVAGDVLEVRDSHDEQAIWGVVSAAHPNLGPQGPAVRKVIGEVLDQLEDKAYVRVELPRRGATPAAPLLGDVVAVLRQNVTDYASALAKCSGDPVQDAAAFNELMRLAYNFSSDASTMLNLVVSICDLKPILLWSTLGEHHALACALRALPWARSRNKANLKNWQLTIGDARNEAFHSAFPFKKALDIELGGGSLQNLSLRTFSKHAKKSGNKLLFDDDKLVDVLVQFSRPGARLVPPAFWVGNQAVMSGIVDVFEATMASLVELRGA